jgi:hypothetical protein
MDCNGLFSNCLLFERGSQGNELERDTTKARFELIHDDVNLSFKDAAPLNS